ncbi:MAG: methyltransferase domain-containing protein [Candidatus Blackburnbacteria bacterium]|nr:methyltransferase domain-containing protein [Candidatus Blackburnbacteria bacterium]
MRTYYSTFIPGLGEVVTSALKERFSDVEIVLLLDGLVVYKTDLPTEEIVKLRFLNNTFYVLHFFKHVRKGDLPSLVKFTFQSDFLKKMELPRLLPSVRSFRIITSFENELGKIDPNLLKNMEEKLARATGLTLDRGKPDLEFWFLERSEGVGFFALRLTHKASGEKLLKPGELRPELANLLCLLSESKAGDVFLDPFAGWGGIVKEADNFPHKKIYASDISNERIKYVSGVCHSGKPKAHPESRLWPSQSDIQVRQADATNLTYLSNQSVDKIVTDPPWGLADQMETQDVEDLYEKAFKEFVRVLKPDGVIVLLTSRKLTMEKFLKENTNFKLVSKYDVLVNGKKAGVYKITRI